MLKNGSKIVIQKNGLFYRAVYIKQFDKDTSIIKVDDIHYNVSNSDICEMIELDDTWNGVFEWVI